MNSAVQAKYLKIYELRTFRHLSELDIQKQLDVKPRTIRRALAYGRKLTTTLTNPEVLHGAIAGVEEVLHETDESIQIQRQSQAEHYNKKKAFALLPDTDKEKEQKIINEETHIRRAAYAIAKLIDTQLEYQKLLYSLQGILESLPSEERSILKRPNIMFQTQIVTLVKNEDGTTRTIPNAEDVLALAEARGGIEDTDRE